MDCPEYTTKLDNFCILTERGVNKYIEEHILPNISYHSVNETNSDFIMYKLEMMKQLPGFSGDPNDFQKARISSNSKIVIKPGKDNYIISAWKQMRTICDMLISQQQQQAIEVLKINTNKLLCTCPQKGGYDESVIMDIVSKIIADKFEESRDIFSKKAIKLKNNIDEIMYLFLKEIYDLVKVDVSNTKEVTEDGSNVFKEYELKRNTFKVKLHVYNDTKHFSFKQKPYLQTIQSYKLAKDIESKDIFKYIPKRNVRISIGSDIPTNMIIAKNMWYKLQRLDEVLLNIQSFFGNVKTLYANSTISLKNQLDTFYPLSNKLKQNLSIYLTEEGKFKPEIEAKVKQTTSSLNKTKYGPTCAGLYGVINNFIEAIIQQKITSQVIDDFRKNLAATLERFVTQAGGGMFSNMFTKANNLMIELGDKATMLIQLVRLQFAQIARKLLTMSRLAAIVLSSLYAGATCGMAVGKSIVGNVNLSTYAKCATGLIMVYVSLQNNDKKIDFIQNQLKTTLKTTDLIVLIMQFGMFKSLHEIIISRFENLLVAGYMDENVINDFQSSIANALKQVQDTSEVDAKNVYVLYEKLFDLLVQNENKNNDAFTYFARNMPSDSEELRKIIMYMIGPESTSEMMNCIPSKFSSNFKSEVLHFLSEEFQNEADRKFILLQLLQKFEPNKITNTQNIWLDHYLNTANNQNSSTINKTQTQISKFLDPTNPDYIKPDSFMALEIIKKLSSITNMDASMSLSRSAYYKYLQCVINKLTLQHKKSTNNNTNISNIYFDILRDIVKAMDELDLKRKHENYVLMIVNEDPITGCPARELYEKFYNIDKIRNFRSKTNTVKEIFSGVLGITVGSSIAL